MTLTEVLVPNGKDKAGAVAALPKNYAKWVDDEVKSEVMMPCYKTKSQLIEALEAFDTTE